MDLKVTVRDKCLSAFENKDYNKAVSLLTLLAEQEQLQTNQRLQSMETKMSIFTIRINSIDPWNNDYLKAGLLHLSSRNGWLDITRKLIEQYQFDLRKGDDKGNTCFQYAAAANQLEIIKYFICTPLLKKKYEGLLHAKNTYGATPLHIAAGHGSLDVMKYFIEHHHCHIKNIDYKGRTVLHYAVKHINIVKYIIEECNCDPIATDKNSKTVLHYAIQRNHLDVVEYLALTNPVNTDGDTYLHFAAKTGQTDLAKQLVVKYNCDTNTANRFGMTILHYAVEQKHLDLVEYLVLTSKCDLILAADQYISKTVLLLAAPKVSLKIIEYLIDKHNCDPLVTDHYGMTALHYAVGQDRFDAVEYLVLTGKCDSILTANSNEYGNIVLLSASARGSLDIIKYFIHKHKFNPMATDKYSNKVLRCAVEHINIVKYLITERYCDPLATDQNGQTVLHYVAKHINIVKYLITECNCDPMVIDENGKTVLHCAAKEIDVVKYLITECYCDPMVADKYGKTVLHYGAEHFNTVKYLITECYCDPMVADKYGKTVLHYGAEDINTVKFLITECKCDPMATDKYGGTILHYVVENNCLDVIEYLLSTGKCDLLAKDVAGRTPLQRGNHHSRWKIQLLFEKFGQVKTSHPVHSYVNVLLLGNSGAGKSTLSHVITETATGSIAFGTFKNVKGVEE